ncbi:Uma2 family endonuclease [Pelomicrobium methylotrophicum]|uniref:Uma2 family endonuclease n=1 Tax=Pelomicrobium methylotrophicum TaxID=2602750 RepID=A0A5C7EJ06_9PROT|nr:Uma2 family endonuclease [Pelomicrobium methylotrophicum]TXF11398.1 Uma2 family endonuclease [Pelomicrobium methylotrophicum]
MSIQSENWLPRHRLTVDEYHRMGEVGLLAPEARVELIEGEIIDRARIGSRHAGTIARLIHLLTAVVGDRAIVYSQSPLRLDEHSEPQPDLALLKPRRDFYTSRHPTASDTLLVVEVSDVTLRYDRQVKVPLYARHGVPEVWIVDLENALTHYFRSPAGETYAHISATERPGLAPIVALPGVAVDLSGLLPSPSE